MQAYDKKLLYDKVLFVVLASGGTHWLCTYQAAFDLR